MEKLIVSSKRDSPEIVLDPKEGVFSIKGVCHPENVTKFFEPVMNWLDEFENEVKKQPYSKEIKVIFYFKYFNSATYKYLISLLQKLYVLKQNSISILVEWRYEREDDEMRESGVELFEFSGIKIPYVCIESDEL
jgi:hypothetical protein